MRITEWEAAGQITIGAQEAERDGVFIGHKLVAGEISKGDVDIRTFVAAPLRKTARDMPEGF